MEPNHSTISMMHMFPHPVFQVKEGIIADMNQAAKQLGIPENVPIFELLATGQEVYENLTDGCLSLNLSIHNTDFLATVIRAADGDVFHLETHHSESSRLCALALAASQLKQPLSEVTTVTELLLAEVKEEHRALTGQLNKSLMQILRMLSNMTDAQDYAERTYQMEALDAVAVINEAMEAAQAHFTSTDKKLVYQPATGTLLTWADRGMLERAVFNLLSNAFKYSPKGSTLRAELALQKGKLSFRVENPCEGMTPERMGTMFFRYQRDAMVEPGEHGIGLGIPMVRSVASAHGGSLLMDQPKDGTIRFTLTIAARPPKHTKLRSPHMDVDQSGGRNACLIELSDILPASEYQN